MVIVSIIITVYLIGTAANFKKTCKIRLAILPTVVPI